MSWDRENLAYKLTSKPLSVLKVLAKNVFYSFSTNNISINLLPYLNSMKEMR